MTNIFIIIMALILTVSSCESNRHVTKDVGDRNPVDISIEKSNYEYNFNFPSNSLILSDDLTEISGLAFDNRDSSLWAVNDEKAFLYRIDTDSGDVIDKIEFGYKGDFEGVVIVEGTAYVSKSNGTLYKYDLQADERGGVITTELGIFNDVEGLTYDESNGCLLIACKGSGKLDYSTEVSQSKSVFSLNVKSEKFIAKPFLAIDDNTLVEKVKSDSLYLTWGKKKKKSMTKRVKKFSPSAIAINPINGDYVILSSVGKLAVILSSDRTLSDIVFLDKNLHKQPEGICFSSEGTMFVSSEGKGLHGRLHIYDF